MKRRISINTIGLAEPQSFISKDKKRLKQHIDTVYLNNGDEFEIELYNPTQNKVLAKIEMNSKSIGNGIILRPGERVFLERYIDEAKKFLFETYNVNGNNEEVQQAIANNGDVVVKFYNENNTYNSGTFTVGNQSIFNKYNYTGSRPFYGSESPLTTTGTNIGFGSTTFTSGNMAYYSNGAINSSLTKMLETGRVEKGSNSDQSFTYDNTSFNSYPSFTNWWKIKPQSTKPVVIEDLVTYCTECGSKRKKDNHKFCPHCGTKF